MSDSGDGQRWTRVRRLDADRVVAKVAVTADTDTLAELTETGEPAKAVERAEGR